MEEKEKDKIDETDAKEDAQKVEELAQEEHEDAKKDEGKETTDRDKFEADDKAKELKELKEMVKDMHGRTVQIYEWFSKLIDSQKNKSDEQVQEQEPETKKWTKEEIDKFAKENN